MELKGNPDIAGYLYNFMGKDKIRPEKMIEDLGKRWVLREIWIKKYPVCFLQHRHIDMVLDLKRKHNFSIEDVDVIEVHASSGDQICNRPEPKTEGDLQFSFQHSLSVAVLDGDVGLGRISEQAVSDRALRENRKKVNVTISPEVSKSVIDAINSPARVKIRMKNGEEFSAEKLYPLGHPKDPLTVQQFRELYAKFTHGILTRELVAKSENLILNLEQPGSFETLKAVLAQIGGTRNDQM